MTTHNTETAAEKIRDTLRFAQDDEAEAALEALLGEVVALRAERDDWRHGCREARHNERVLEAEVGRVRQQAEQLRQALDIIPPEKLELLAEWFDLDDANKGGGRGVGVQADLRRMAHAARAALAGADALPSEDKETTSSFGSESAKQRMDGKEDE